MKTLRMKIFWLVVVVSIHDGSEAESQCMLACAHICVCMYVYMEECDILVIVSFNEI